MYFFQRLKKKRNIFGYPSLVGMENQPFLSLWNPESKRMGDVPGLVMTALSGKGFFSTHHIRSQIPRDPSSILKSNKSKSHQHCVDHHCLQRVPITVLLWPVLKPRQYPRYSRRSLSSVVCCRLDQWSCSCWNFKGHDPACFKVHLP